MQVTGSKHISHSGMVLNTVRGQQSRVVFADGAPLPAPKKIIYRKALDSSWVKTTLYGIDNIGLNCYMNTIIQCLQYVPMWSNYLWNDHGQDCNLEYDECYTCILSGSTESVLRQSKGKTILTPTSLFQKMNLLSESFTKDDLHDAHEYLIRLLENAQSSILMFKDVDQYEAMTTAVGKIFGGFLRSQIACQRCLMTSNTYEPYFNISLNVVDVNSVITALNYFFGTDTMHDEEWYSCEHCQQKTRAGKRYTIETLPEVMIFQLNRLDMYGNKSDHHVKFPQNLDLQSYMSSDGDSCTYRLYGVIDHVMVNTTKNRIIGHYRSHISHPAFEVYDWHCIDDEKVSRVNWSSVADLNAYLLFYIKSKCADNETNISNCIELIKNKFQIDSSEDDNPQKTNNKPKNKKNKKNKKKGNKKH